MADQINSGFEHALNQHGYAFQHRVIREAARIKDTLKSSAYWDLLSVEQPVSVNDRTTRIDFILIAKQGSKCWLLVAECKRVNPAFGSWCFARGAYQEPMWLGNQVLFEVLTLKKGRSISGAAGGDNSHNIFDIGFTLKLEKSGDAHPVGNDRDAIEQACSQTILGINGLIQTLGREEPLVQTLEGISTVTLVPVVFTTATLQSSDVDLRTTDLKTGEVKLAEPPKDEKWVYFQYPQSPVMRHSVTRAGSPWGDSHPDSWSEIVARDYWRTIAIVSAEGVSDFLCRKPPGYL